MANICGFSMRVRGKKDDIEKFHNAMQQKGNVYMGRGSDADIEYEDEDGYSVGWIQGWCKWSVQSAMIDNAISMRTEPNTLNLALKDLKMHLTQLMITRSRILLQDFMERCIN